MRYLIRKSFIEDVPSNKREHVLRKLEYFTSNLLKINTTQLALPMEPGLEKLKQLATRIFTNSGLTEVTE